MSEEGTWISNTEINKIIEINSNVDLKINFTSVFLLSNFQNLVKSKISNCLFLIFYSFNRDRSDKTRNTLVQCFSFTSEEDNFSTQLFWSKSFEKLHNTRRCKVSQKKKIFPLEKFMFPDNKLTQVRMTFLRATFDRLEQNKNKKTKHDRQGFISFYCRVSKITHCLM